MNCVKRCFYIIRNLHFTHQKHHLERNVRCNRKKYIDIHNIPCITMITNWKYDYSAFSILKQTARKDAVTLNMQHAFSLFADSWSRFVIKIISLNEI